MELDPSGRKAEMSKRFANEFGVAVDASRLPDIFDIFTNVFVTETRELFANVGVVGTNSNKYWSWDEKLDKRFTISVLKSITLEEPDRITVTDYRSTEISIKFYGDEKITIEDSGVGLPIVLNSPSSLVTEIPTRILNSLGTPLYWINLLSGKIVDTNENLKARKQHFEWIKEVAGTKVDQIKSAGRMPGLEEIPLEDFVVSSVNVDCRNIRQLVIPLELVKEPSNVSADMLERIKLLKEQLGSDDVLFLLARDDEYGTFDKWTLSVLIPIQLNLPETQIRQKLDSAILLQDTLREPAIISSSYRAALLAKTGKTSI